MFNATLQDDGNLDIIFGTTFFIHFKPFVLIIGIVYTIKIVFKTSKASYQAAKMSVGVRLLTKCLQVKYGEYVVITNVIDTIGVCFAKAFARAGHSVFIMGTNKQHLHLVKNSIINCLKPGKEVRILWYDETKSDADNYTEVEKQIAEVKQQLGILVNNCSLKFKASDKFLDHSREEILNLLNADVEFALIITRIVMPVMIENKKGLILNVTVPNNFRPVAHKGFPYAMRQFIDYFGELITQECHENNIHVQTVNPGWVWEHDKCGKTKCFPLCLRPTASTFVNSAMRTMGRTDKTTGYWSHALVNAFLEATPCWLHKCIYFIYRLLNGKNDDLNASEEGEYLFGSFDDIMKECEGKHD